MLYLVINAFSISPICKAVPVGVVVVVVVSAVVVVQTFVVCPVTTSLFPCIPLNKSLISLLVSPVVVQLPITLPSPDRIYVVGPSTTRGEKKIFEAVIFWIR